MMGTSLPSLSRLFALVIVIGLALPPVLMAAASTPAAQGNEIVAARADPAAGASWQRVWKGDGYVFAVAARDTQTLLGAGSDGMILKSTDAGATWAYQAPVPGKDLYDLSQIGASVWAVGQGGLVLRSLDGGTGWQQLASGLTGNLSGVHFLDANSGWVVGESGLIARTTNGGSSWTPQSSGVTAHLRAIRMFGDALHGVAVGDGVFLTTTNGGGAWTIRAGVAPAGVALRDVYVQGSEAWVVGNADTLRYSNDSGATWSPKTVGAGADLHEVEFAPGQGLIGWVAGADGTIARTTNGGSNWTAAGATDGSDKAGRDLSALAAADGSRAWAGGSVSVKNDGNWDGDTSPRQSWFMWRTENGSAWKHLLGGHYPRFFEITAASDDVAYAVGDYTLALKTTDGGNTWRELYRELRSDPATPPTADSIDAFLMGVACAPTAPDDCHAVGRGGLVLHTTNGGDTWRREYAPGYGGYLYDVGRISGSVGVATGTWHYFRTGDGGASWADAANNGGNTPGIDLDMISNSTGAMAILKPFLKYTWNGGANWGSKTLPAKYESWFFDGVAAVDADTDGALDHAWLAGCARAPGAWVHTAPCVTAAVVRTTDGGQTWTDFQLPNGTPLLEDIDMVDTTTGWAVGDQGLLAATVDGGATWTRVDVPVDGVLYGIETYGAGLAYAAGH